MTLHVCCVRVGTKYGRDYVAILHDMVSRHLADDHQFWCLTDDPEPIHPEIGVIEADAALPGWWQKLKLFCPDMPWKAGDRIVYFDLDVAIVGRLEELVKTCGIIRDWNLPGFNSSVMVWDAGDHAAVWREFHPGVMQEMPGDQDWITAQAYVGREAPGAEPTWNALPRDWCVSYRAHAQDFPPNGTKVVVFHGHPKPHECGGWVPNVWRVGGFAEMTTGEGMNVGLEHVLENIRVNSARPVPWFVGSQPHKDTAVIVGGAPSLKDHIPAIREHQRRGAAIVALNNAGAFLNAHGIVPSVLMVCDARAENVVFVRAEAKRYLLASQCDPSLFDALEGRDVHMVQLWVCDEQREILKPYEETEPVILLGGGCTVGLRAFTVMIVSGYRKLHVYGMDSSFAEGRHHAYDQQLNDEDRAYEAYVPALDKRYWVAPWMARQAAEYRDIVHPALVANGIKTWVHGSGLLPDMHRHLTRQSSKSMASGGRRLTATAA